MDSSSRNLVLGGATGLKRRRSTSNDADAYREKKLGLGHKIFLSYSGADQVFLWEIYDDLLEHNYDPFFDKKSLPITAPVSMRNIVSEAAGSKLAVFCLSEAFFTRNKNPMLELVECVQNEVRLLPLFYKISVDMIKKSMESWYNGEWSKWDKIDRNEFKQALETLLLISGIENIEGWRPRQFRRRVIEEIQKIIPPDIRPDVSGICGGGRLVRVVEDMFDKLHLSLDESTQAPAVFLGLYGESGTGKSTLCKMLAHSECPVCYIELDSSMDKKAQLARMKKVLSYVTNLSTDFINKLTEPDEVQQILFERDEYELLFLIIDNVMPESLKEARIYLDGMRSRFKPGSKALITAHTKDVLDNLADAGGKWYIDAMPDLQKEEAKQILLKRAGSIQVKEEVVERCLNLCRFRKGGGRGVHYHPLMLNALAESLADRRPYSDQKMLKWVNSLESSFSPTDSDAKGRVLQHLLKSTSYDSLNALQKQVFLDLAFCLPTELQEKGEILEWLQLVHGKNIENTVWILERRGLIDLSELPNQRFRLMHDLYYEMVTLIVEEKESECFVMQGDGAEMQFPLTKCKKISRIRCHDHHFRGELVLQTFSSLQVLAITNCEGVQKLDLRGLVCLRSLTIQGQPTRNATKPSFYSEMVHLPKLRYLNLDLKSAAFNPPIDFSSCIHLQILFIRNGSQHPDLRPLTNLQVFKYKKCQCSLGFEAYKIDCDFNPVVFYFGHKIKNICINGCNHVSGLKGLNHNCTSLRELLLINCKKLKAVEGLAELMSLRKLWLIKLGLTALSKLPKQIENLKIDGCKLIPHKDIIAIMSTPGLPTHFYFTSMSILLTRLIDSSSAKRRRPSWYFDGFVGLNLWPSMMDVYSWRSVGLEVESKEVSDNISNVLRDRFHCTTLAQMSKGNGRKRKKNFSYPHVQLTIGDGKEETYVSDPHVQLTIGDGKEESCIEPRIKLFWDESCNKLEMESFSDQTIGNGKQKSCIKSFSHQTI